MHINRFMNAHLDDMARSNRFKVEIHGPQGIRMRGMRCTTVSIPGRTISTNSHAINQAGPPREFPSNVDYGGSVDLTFMLDTTFEDHQKIALWNSYIYDEAWGFRYPEEYWGTVKITQFDRQEQPIYEVELLEAWPSAFGSLEYDSAGAEAGIQTFSCTIQYRTWVSSYENSPSGLLGGLFKKVSRRLKSKVKSKIEDKVFSKVGAGGLASKLFD